MRLIAAVLVVLTADAVSAQTDRFDAASVKLFNPSESPVFGFYGGPGTKDPGRIHMGGVPLINLLTRAFGVDYDLVKGPSWISDYYGQYRYVLDATMPPGTSQEQFQTMFQNLLKDRFHLAVHREVREFPGYDLVVAEGGARLDKAAPVTEADGIRKPGGFTSSRTTTTRDFQNVTMGEVAKGLGGQIADSLDLDPWPRVRDRTGLVGRYDLKLEYSCAACAKLHILMPPALVAAGASKSSAHPEASEPDSNPLPDIFGAVQKFGLRLVKSKGIPLEVIIIDRVDQVPTAN